MSNKNILYRGAEAEIVTSKYLGFDVVLKRRISKKYRIEEIDSRLILSRTKEEAKLISEARKSGVCVPIIYDVDLLKGTIVMQNIKGKRIKDILNNLKEEERKNLCIKIGENIACLHNNNIIHGDITTSNMILFDDCVYFIDFGLGEINTEIEAKGVDLHVLMEAFESTHSKYPGCFDFVLKGYKNKYKRNPNLIVKKIEEIVRRGRYR